MRNKSRNCYIRQISWYYKCILKKKQKYNYIILYKIAFTKLDIIKNDLKLYFTIKFIHINFIFFIINLSKNIDILYFY